jgi:hypothetical protein
VEAIEPSKESTEVPNDREESEGPADQSRDVREEAGSAEEQQEEPSKEASQESQLAELVDQQETSLATSSEIDPSLQAFFEEQTVDLTTPTDPLEEENTSLDS